MLFSREGGVDKPRQKIEGIDSIKVAGSDDSQQAPGKVLADLRLRPETDFPPLHGRSDGPFGAIVGGLDAIMFEKGEKVLPVVKQSSGSSLYSWVGTVAENDAEIVHPFPHGQSIEDQLCPGTGFAEGQESMPEGEYSRHFAPHFPGKAIRMRA